MAVEFIDLANHWNYSIMKGKVENSRRKNSSESRILNILPQTKVYFKERNVRK